LYIKGANIYKVHKENQELKHKIKVIEQIQLKNQESGDKRGSNFAFTEFFEQVKGTDCNTFTPNSHGINTKGNNTLFTPPLDKEYNKSSTTTKGELIYLKADKLDAPIPPVVAMGPVSVALSSKEQLSTTKKELILLEPPTKKPPVSPDNTPTATQPLIEKNPGSPVGSPIFQAEKVASIFSNERSLKELDERSEKSSVRKNRSSFTYA